MAPSSKPRGSGSYVKLILILVAAVVLAAMVAWFKSKGSSGQSPSAAKPEGFRGRRGAAARRLERFEAPAAAAGPSDMAPAPVAPAPPAAGGMWAPGSPAPLEDMANEQFLPVDDRASSSAASSAGGSDAGSFPGDRLKPEDLLPKDAANSKWAQAHPAGQGDIKDQNFLTAGYHMGYNTQGSSLRNASHDLRATPPNPRYTVSVWNQSTIEPDLNRRSLE